ncbi:hypothetical protein L9F63_017387 [Diploptera punctata]|uniref:Major facilitator superfamily (MFS) profile domain-containing protein n=1 Tax=Diploptera punctata TaxID=6984 RepID=A0AAD8EGF1_DIPPU|nr:hypothetical protein L9F63_017387 [Diploptera punctata]
MGEIAISIIENVNNLESKTAKLGSTKFPQFLAAFTVGFLCFAYGSATGWLSPTLPFLQSNNSAIGIPPITEEEASWLSSLPFLGALVATPVFSFICQYFGRKAGGYVTVMPAIVSWIIIIFSNSILQLYIARFLVGLAFGGIIVFVPMYTGEMAEDSIRGALGAFLPMICNIGTVFTYAVAPFMSIQIMSIISLIPPLIYVFAFYWLPESPTYFMSKGKTDEASNSMLWFRGKIKDSAERDLQKLKDLMDKKSNPNSSAEKNLKKLFFSRGTVRALTICFVVCAAQQLSGIYIVLNYCNEIMSNASSDVSPYIASVSVAAIQLLGSIVASFTVEIYGRKIMLITSQIAMGVCLGSLGTYFYYQNQGEDLTNFSMLPVICVSVYLFANGVGPAPIGYVLISETFHPDIRGVATTIASSNIWALAFMITKLYPLMLGLLGMHGCYWTFATVCVLCTVYTVFQIPETRNRTLESILNELNGEKS